MNKKIDISSSTIRIFAMFVMLLDHMWATLFPRQEWMTCVGRMAFPIFAFLIVEGFFHTRNLKNYIKRLAICALISEIPFNLMYQGKIFYPLHQNVIVTFLIAITIMYLIERTKEKGKLWLTILVSILLSLLGFILGIITFADYYGTGVLTVLAFYFFHERKWWCYLGQALSLWWINVELLGGLCYPVTIFGYKFEIEQQALALLSLILIWMYHGRQGYNSKVFKWFYYAFYPLHTLILGLLMVFGS